MQLTMQTFILLALPTFIDCSPLFWNLPYGARERQNIYSVVRPRYYINNVDGVQGTYAFGYDISDPSSQNNQYRTEQRYPNGTVAGSYGYLDARGRPVRYQYVADERGYRVKQLSQPLWIPSPSPHHSSNYLVESYGDDQPEVHIIGGAGGGGGMARGK